MSHTVHLTIQPSIQQLRDQWATIQDIVPTIVHDMTPTLFEYFGRDIEILFFVIHLWIHKPRHRTMFMYFGLGFDKLLRHRSFVGPAPPDDFPKLLRFFKKHYTSLSLKWDVLRNYVSNMTGPRLDQLEHEKADIAALFGNILVMARDVRFKMNHISHQTVPSTKSQRNFVRAWIIRNKRNQWRSNLFDMIHEIKKRGVWRYKVVQDDFHTYCKMIGEMVYYHDNQHLPLTFQPTWRDRRYIQYFAGLRLDTNDVFTWFAKVPTMSIESWPNNRSTVIDMFGQMDRFYNDLFLKVRLKWYKIWWLKAHLRRRVPREIYRIIDSFLVDRELSIFHHQQIMRKKKTRRQRRLERQSKQMKSAS